VIALDVASWVLIVAGAVLSIISGIGMIRMPTLYTRTHAAGIGDTMGAALVLLGLTLQAGPGLTAVKLVMVLLLVWLTSPTTTHALVKGAYAHGVKVRIGEPDAD